MGKKIKTTLSSKVVTRAQVVARQRESKKEKEEEDFFEVELPVIQEEPDNTMPQSKVNILQDHLFDEEEEPAQVVRKAEKKTTFNPLVRSEAVSNL